MALTSDEAGRVPRPRFELTSALPTVPGVMMDSHLNGVGLAQQTARAQNLQARILWIDCTANIDRYNTEEKIVDVVRRTKDAGFNTIVFDVKPISGQVIYRSRFAPRLEEWRGRRLPADFEPVPIMIREARKAGLSIFLAINAFSEGHRNFLVGPGYQWRDRQTVLYETQNLLRMPDQTTFALASRANEVQAETVNVFTSVDRLPAPVAGDNTFWLTVRPNGTVVDGFAPEGMVPPPTPTIPRGGVILHGTRAAGDYLRRALPNEAVRFETAPLFVPISERPEQQIPLMMNPNHPEVLKYAENIAEELITEFDSDGLIYDDRLRYGGINADFSEETRTLFEERVGRRLQWPDDVFRFTINPNLSRGIRPGPYYQEWLSFRAEIVRNFVQRIGRLVREKRPSMQYGVYAGSWYGEYANIGSNWAAETAESAFWFATPQYRATGFASDLDFLITGCYYPTATIFDAMERGLNIGGTVEAGGILTNRLVNDATWSYAGIMLSDFRNDPDGLVRALQAATGATQGVMVFDLSHDIEPMWPVFTRAFAQPRVAPHRKPEVLADVRRRKAELIRRGVREPPIPFLSGIAGTGQ